MKNIDWFFVFALGIMVLGFMVPVFWFALVPVPAAVPPQAKSWHCVPYVGCTIEKIAGNVSFVTIEYGGDVWYSSFNTPEEAPAFVASVYADILEKEQ